MFPTNTQPSAINSSIPWYQQSHKSKKLSRIETLAPILYSAIEAKYSNVEYFTRDQLIQTYCLRSFSYSYRLCLIGEIIKQYIKTGELLKLTQTDLAVATKNNLKLYRAAQYDNSKQIATSYTTRAADELVAAGINDVISADWLANNLQCLSVLVMKARQQYAKRILSDLEVRGVLRKIDSLNYILIKL